MSSLIILSSHLLSSPLHSFPSHQIYPGNIIWLAPSGGRDRPDPESGKFVVAPFDVKSLDMFKLMAMQSEPDLHFFPMAMYTHKLVLTNPNANFNTNTNFYRKQPEL